MNSAPAELLKSYVQSQTFTSTTEVMLAMKEMFRDVIQQVMESELEQELALLPLPIKHYDASKCADVRVGFEQSQDGAGGAARRPGGTGADAD